MHELSLAMSIVDLVEREAAKSLGFQNSKPGTGNREPCRDRDRFFIDFIANW